jgi:hypothetical protein
MLPDVVIAYVAHTDRATFLLDAEGICQHVIPAALPPHPRPGDIREKEAAERCLGAQYVASIDVREKGGLVDLPRAGVPLLFAIADARGRISVIRTAPLMKFEVRPQMPSGFAPRANARDSVCNEFEQQVNSADISGPHVRGSHRAAAGSHHDDYAEEVATRIFDHESVLEEHEARLREARRKHAVPPPPMPRSPRQLHVPSAIPGGPTPVSGGWPRGIHKKII